MKTREPRRKVIVRARMRLDTTWGDVCIRDLSSRGLMAQAAQPPASGSYIEIRRGSQCVVGRVVWRSGRNFGVRAQDRIDIDGIVNEIPTRPGGGQGDRRTNRGGPSPTPRTASPAEQLAASKRFAASFQFLLVAALGVGGAVYAAMQMHAVLSAPMTTIVDAMAGRPVQ